MSSLTTASLVFACVFGASLLGMFLRAVLPSHHLGSDTKDSVKVAMGLVATMSALLLGLLVASAKSSYDAERNGTIQMAAKLGLLDRELAHYGPEAAGTRKQLHDSVERAIALMWPEAGSKAAQLDPTAVRGDAMYEAIQQLSPQNDVQRSLKAQILSATVDLGQLRWLLFEQSVSSISPPLLIVVVCWLTVIFLSFGLFSPPNATVIIAFLLAALSVSGAMLLILELDRPFDGMIQIPSQPLRDVLRNMVQ